MQVIKPPHYKNLKYDVERSLPSLNSQVQMWHICHLSYPPLNSSSLITHVHIMMLNMNYVTVVLEYLYRHLHSSIVLWCYNSTMILRHYAFV